MANEDKIPPERLSEQYIKSNIIKDFEVVQEYPAEELEGVLYIKVET